MSSPPQPGRGAETVQPGRGAENAMPGRGAESSQSDRSTKPTQPGHSTEGTQPGHSTKPTQPGGGARSLAQRQAELVATLTSGAPVPPGFDDRLVETARVALLRKRAGEVARQWPALAAAYGGNWPREFARWATRRPTQGSLRDGWDLARDLGVSLPATAAEELAAREVAWRYDGVSAPSPRRTPALRSAAGSVVVQIAGWVRTVRRG